MTGCDKSASCAPPLSEFSISSDLDSDSGRFFVGVLDKKGMYHISSLLATTAVGVLVISGTSPGILMALRLRG